MFDKGPEFVRGRILFWIGEEDTAGWELDPDSLDEVLVTQTSLGRLVIGARGFSLGGQFRAYDEVRQVEFIPNPKAAHRRWPWSRPEPKSVAFRLHLIDGARLVVTGFPHPSAVFTGVSVMSRLVGAAHVD